MEIEKRYKTYGIALGIDLCIEKRYRTFQYNSLGRNRTLTRTPRTFNEKFPYIWFYNIQNAVTKINTELTNEFLVEIYFRNYTDLLKNFVNFK